MARLRIGGVPEHFNLPWRLAIESGALSDIGIDAEWIDVPGGTGAIMAHLADGTLDLATPLTEGLLAAMASGHEAKLVRTWVDSPLLWGIFVAGNSPHRTVDDLRGLRFAISRWGSGSELMARVLADSRGWALDNAADFVVINNLDGALEALPAGDAEIFLWNKSMTQPHVDNGTLRLAGEFPTPWPSFCTAAAKDVEPALITTATAIAETKARTLAASPGTPELVAERYDIDLSGAQDWFSTLRWNTDGSPIDHDMVQQVLDKLHAVGRLDSRIEASELLAT